MKMFRQQALAIPLFFALLVSIPTSLPAQTAVPLPAGTMADKAVEPVLVAKIAANLSTRNAKPGDAVMAKTLKAAKLSDGTEVPKGSKLIGNVAAVRSKQAGNGKSLLTFRFDQLEPKGGSPIAIKGLVIAIGPALAPKDLFGANSVMARSGTGSSNGLDPNAGLGSAGAKDETNIPLGSTMQSVALGRHMDADWTTALEGFKTEIDLDSDVLVKVQLK